MFELITISNGVAVVQHAPTGHVYRFRPLHPGLWHALTLDRVDAAGERQGVADDHADAALTFTTDAIASLAYAMTADLLAEQADIGRRPANRLRFR
jgi:hypothetical protein